MLPLVRDCQLKPVQRSQVTVYFYKYRLCIINSGFTSMQIKSSYDSDCMHLFYFFLSNMAYISQIIFSVYTWCYSEYLTRNYKVYHKILVNGVMEQEEIRENHLFSLYSWQVQCKGFSYSRWQYKHLTTELFRDTSTSCCWKFWEFTKNKTKYP